MFFMILWFDWAYLDSSGPHGLAEVACNYIQAEGQMELEHL